jgi:hypothetical protein
MPFSLAKLYINPARLMALSAIFDTVCQEAPIPLTAKAERDELARVIVRKSYTTENDKIILEAARRAAVALRARLTTMS